MHINFDAVYQGDSKFARETSKTQTPGGVLRQILDRGVPRRFLNPNPV